MKLCEVAQTLNLSLDATIAVATAILQAANTDVPIDAESTVSDDLLNAIEVCSAYMKEHEISPVEAVQAVCAQKKAATDALTYTRNCLSVADLATELDVSPARVVSILETLYDIEADENTELNSGEVMQQVKTVVLYMAEHEIADAAVAAQAIREEMEADLLPQTFGALSEHDADLAVVREDVLNRLVGFEIASNIEFAAAVANGYDEDQLSDEQKNALDQSRNLVKAVISKRFGRTTNLFQMLASGKRPISLSIAATPIAPKLLESSKQR